MGVMRMGYVHARVTDLEEAKGHYANTMGLYETLSEPGKVYYEVWDEWDPVGRPRKGRRRRGQVRLQGRI